MSVAAANRRILFVDDNDVNHATFRAFLVGATADRAQRHGSSTPAFQIDSAFSGEEGIRLAVAAIEQMPYAAAFVSIDLTSALDGMRTAKLMLEMDAELQVVICAANSAAVSADPTQFDAAYAKYTSADILHEFRSSGRVVLLNLPFDAAETCLLATSLLEKWRLTHEMNRHFHQQSDQIADTRRVMSIIEGCLNELEHAHDELRVHSIELTDRLVQREAEIVGTRDLAMFALAQLADSRDPETGEHLLRMRAYAQLLAKELSLRGPYVEQVNRAFLADFYRSTPLHDIGKVGIPDQILLKPGPLTRDEFDIMKRHTIIGAEALERAAAQSNFGGFLKMAASIARSHHERFDGKGYPDALRGAEIPLCARITAVADVFDALTSARVYKDAMPAEEAKQLILGETGKHFDPSIIEAFEAVYDEFLEVKESIDGGEVDPSTPIVCFDQPLPLFDALAGVP